MTNVEWFALHLRSKTDPQVGANLTHADTSTPAFQYNNSVLHPIL